jgi:hypothetical protein
MKPLHIVILVAAGAMAGAVIMKMTSLSRTAAAPMVAQVQTPPAIALATPPVVPAAPPAVLAATPAVPAATPAVPADAQPTAVPANLSPFESPKPVRAVPKPRRAQPTAAARPLVVEAPPIQTDSRAAVPAATPSNAEPEQPAPQPVPPARLEPENVTPPPPPPAPPEPHRVTLNAGILIPVRLVDGLTSERNLPGDSFTATLDKELVADGFVIAERGARVEGRVVSADRVGRLRGVSSLAVELVRLHTSDGQTVAIQTDGFERRAEDTHRQDAEKVAGGAALGAVIGALAGGGKGAAIGAGVGGGAGAGTVMATRGNAATLPSETRVTFRLKTPVTLIEKLPSEPQP